MKTRQPSERIQWSHLPTTPDREAPAPSEIRRKLPIGAEILPSGGAHFRVWAPRSKGVAVRLMSSHSAKGSRDIFNLDPEQDGYFSGKVQHARPGMLYKFQLDSGEFPDPASRFQPEGPHGPSAIIDPRRFNWSDAGWQGARAEGHVIYEMHIGTFTREGTWRAASERLSELARLGITMVEVMPVADFCGRFGWGYDGVNLFAPTRLYGEPDDFRAFVNRAHEAGLGVILDVVYNHLGPDGNYLKEFSGHYFSADGATEWGEAINFDGPDSGPVREFFIANAGYWIDEFHLDGLRLDATQQIFDRSREHIVTAVARQVREAAKGRSTFVVAENEEQHSRLIRASEHGGMGMDAVWNDDFHHSAFVALAGRNEAYYSDYRGAAQEFISSAKYGYLFQGQWYVWQKKRRGLPAFGIHPKRFVVYLQNHDQVANSPRGVRIQQFSSHGQFRAMTALLLLGPNTPMLFQGQEFGASTPFLFFADHNPELAKLVRQGRKRFLSQFPSIARIEADVLADPGAEETFLKCRLDWSEREKHAPLYALHHDLLKLRQSDPVFKSPKPGGVDGAVLGPDAFVLRFFGESNGDRLLLMNLGADQHLNPAPEPLLAPMEGCDWKLEWSSEDTRYGGGGTPELETAKEWLIPGHAAVVLFPEKLARPDSGDPDGKP